MNSKAFTLAETLITVGIIGIIAALTLPSLIENHQKKITVTRLKAFNSIMAQAFQTAKLEYGDWENWDNSNFGESSSDKGDGKQQLLWLVKIFIAEH